MIDAQTLQWAIGLLVTVNMGVTGWLAARLWAHVMECRTVGEKVATHAGDLERMKEDIGTHDTGMRGHLHDTAGMCTQHELRITLLERPSGNQHDRR